MPNRFRQRSARPAVAVALASSSLVAAAAVAFVFLSTAQDAWTSISASGPAGPADGILLLVAVGGGLLSLWLGLGMALSALSALPGALGQGCSQLATHIAPSAVRKVVAFILGTTLTAAFIPGTAVARTGQDGSRAAVVASTQHSVSGLVDAAPDASFRFISGPAQDAQDLEAAPAPSWSYDQPAPIELVSRGGAPTTSHADIASRVEGAMAADGASLADGVVVHRGDSLWSIAARHLGPSATAADIDAEWHRWYVANRDVIGADANLLHPGQRLACPATSQENS